MLLLPRRILPPSSLSSSSSSFSLLFRTARNKKTHHHHYRILSTKPLVEHHTSSSSSSSSSTKTTTTTTTTTNEQQEEQKQKSRRIPNDGKTLSHFISSTTDTTPTTKTPHSSSSSLNPPASSSSPLTYHLKTYGCQMNIADSEIIRSLLSPHYIETSNESNADIILTNTCAIRDNAERKVWSRLHRLRHDYGHRSPIVGVVGCMAERLKTDLFEKNLCDLVVGPDAYRDLPTLIKSLERKEVERAVQVRLSLEETYADVNPIRKENGVCAFVSVMRGCNNMCSYCVVPFTRGRERSRDLQSIVDESRRLVLDENVKEIILLGQNVNSYHDKKSISSQNNNNNTTTTTTYTTSNPGFTNMYKNRNAPGYYFSDLLAAISDISPELRVRFTSPHPKDYPPELLSLMSERHNICNQLHMPAQSGSSRILEAMRRGYDREAYLQVVADARSAIPGVALSSDFISGFCGETEDDHELTLSLMREVKYDMAYMFAYSLREKTHAHRRLVDDVEESVKKRRLNEVIALFREIVQEKNEREELGRLRVVLVEGDARRKGGERGEAGRRWSGRTDHNKRVIFGKDNVVVSGGSSSETMMMMMMGREGGDGVAVDLQAGDYAVVEITEVTGHTLRGRALWRTTLKDFHELGLLSVDREKDIVRGYNERVMMLERGAKMQQQQRQMDV